MKNIFSCLLIIVLHISPGCKSIKTVEISSPDKIHKLSFGLHKTEAPHSQIAFSLNSSGKKVLNSVTLDITSPEIAFDDLKITGTKRSSHSGTWTDQFGSRSEIPDIYNEAAISLEVNNIKVNVLCRVYNEGVALSYEFPDQSGTDSLTITDEKLVFSFSGDHTAWSAARAQAAYSRRTVKTIEKGCERPLVIEIDSSLTVALAEAGLVDYARMKFDPDSSEEYSLRSRLDGPVKRKLPFRSPWRVIMIGNGPGDLLEKNYLLSNLNEPCAINDISWIKPGKAVREVTLTTTGAKSLVDFIEKHRLQYIEFDAGWYGYEYDDASDARRVNLDPRRSKGPLDLREVIKYAGAKGIGVILYVNRRALEKQIDELLPIYSDWGIAGLKFGFVQVGTQPVTAWMHEAVRKAADYKMIVDIHDEYRPTGWSRTYPNLLTQEGIRGDEESPSNSHTLITMFTRMLAGAGDNTVCYYDRRVNEKMGSHASQLAKTVCIFSPLQFLFWYDRTVPQGKESELAGKPNYLGDEPELEFFANVPTTWDETRVLHAKIGEYGVIARRKGEDWFIGGINGSSGRVLDVRFDFLTDGIEYEAKIYSDDPATETRTQVRTETIKADRGSVYRSVLRPNNGFAIHVFPEGSRY